MPGAQIKHIPPDFTINSVKGWNSRLLYTFYGHVSADFDYVVNSANFEGNLFDVISGWQSNNGYIASKGQYIFPGNGYFFKTGKSIRIKGNLLLTTTDTPASVFNINAKIKNETTNTITSIASTNRGNNHTVGKDGAAFSTLPINFEVTYYCAEDSGPELYFGAHGFYQYQIDNYQSSGANSTTIYSPIWANSQFTSVGALSNSYSLHLSFDGSVSVSGLKLRHLTVEELS